MNQDRQKDPKLSDAEEALQNLGLLVQTVVPVTGEEKDLQEKSKEPSENPPPKED